MATNSQMPRRGVRRVYMVTYSQADLNKFPERSDFSHAVEEAFNSGESRFKTMHHATCRELHQDGQPHYHCCIKLQGPKRWNPAKKYLEREHNIEVHFSDDHDSYYSAYRYVTKEDSGTYHSADHPNMESAGSPKSKHCLKALKQKRKSSSTTAEDTASS